MNPRNNQTGQSKKAEDLIPHSGPMCLVDDLLWVKDKHAETSTVIKSGGQFVREDGTLEECVFVEMIAQSIAAASGFDLTEEQRRTQQGYLLGIKNIKITGTARVGDRLNVKVFKSAQFGDFAIIEGSVLRGDETLAAGEIKVVQILEAPGVKPL